MGSYRERRRKEAETDTPLMRTLRRWFPLLALALSGLIAMIGKAIGLSRANTIAVLIFFTLALTVGFYLPPPRDPDD